MTMRAPQRPVVDVDQLGRYGHGMNRPESVLCLASGDVFASHKAAGVVHIHPDGSQRIIGRAALVDGHELVPNGIALLPDGHLLLANIGEAGGVWRLGQDGSISPFLMEVDGVRLAAANFVLNDAQGRIWISVSTRSQPRFLAYRTDVADGFVAMVDSRGARIVADRCAFTNELRFSSDGKAAFVSETFGRRISRFEVRADGSFGPRSTFFEFGRGSFPDGIEFDEAEHLWVTCIVANQVFRIAPTGEAVLYVEDSDPDHVSAVEDALAAGRMSREHFYTMKSRRLRNISSIGFGGRDRRTAFLGSLMDDCLVTFQVPVPGRRPVHWDQVL